MVSLKSGDGVSTFVGQLKLSPKLQHAALFHPAFSSVSRLEP